MSHFGATGVILDVPQGAGGAGGTRARTAGVEKRGPPSACHQPGGQDCRGLLCWEERDEGPALPLGLSLRVGSGMGLGSKAGRGRKQPQGAQGAHGWARGARDPGLVGDSPPELSRGNGEP